MIPAHGFRTASALTLTALILCAGCGPESGAPTGEARLPNIVVIVVDTLRADHLGTYGYFRDTSPNLDRFAERAAVFENTVTVMATTLPAHVSLWSSRLPLQTGVVTNGRVLHRSLEAGRQVRFFAEMLKEIGYTTAAFVSANPVKRYTGLDAGFDVYDEPAPKAGHRYGKANFTTDAALEWLAEPPREPFFLWIHYFDPHKPFEPPVPYDEAFSTDPDLVRFLAARSVEDPEDPEILEANNLYDGEILWTDSQIQRVFDRLEEMGVLADAAVVVTSDHGEALGEHGRIGHGEIRNEQLFVPLIVKFPDGSALNGRRFDHLVSLTDVVPTLVGRLGLPIQEADRDNFEGRDALAGRTPRDYAIAQRTYRLDGARAWGKGEKLALVGLDWKYYLVSDGEDELFDMTRDRPERHDLLHGHPDVARDLKDRLLRDLAELERDGGQFEVMEERSPAVLEELRALGYLD